MKVLISAVKFSRNGIPPPEIAVPPLRPSTHTTPWPHFIIDVGLVQRGYSIPSPVLLKCCVASVVARSIVLYRTCTGQPAVWGFVSMGLTHCDRVFLFFRGSHTVGGPWWVWSLFRSVAGQLFLQYFDAVGWVF